MGERGCGPHIKKKRKHHVSAHSRADRRVGALVAKLRTNLRRQYGFPAGSASGKSKPFGIPCVYSDEPLRQPAAESVAAIGAAPGTRIGFGSGVVVTGSVGLRLASLVVNATVEATPDEESAR